MDDIADLKQKLAEAVSALGKLHATVWGECPSLLNEDSGGNSGLDMEIRGILESPRCTDERPCINCFADKGPCLGPHKEALTALLAAERERCANYIDVAEGVPAYDIHGGQETIDVLREMAKHLRSLK